MAPTLRVEPALNALSAHSVCSPPPCGVATSKARAVGLGVGSTGTVPSIPPSSALPRNWGGSAPSVVATVPPDSTGPQLTGPSRPDIGAAGHRARGVAAASGAIRRGVRDLRADRLHDSLDP